ncbi:unnamed protein product [Medioppia subpectinata]|uniref:GTP-binding protein Rhes n=2 Tax=Medioppia subpectinata TaxID=1979941 RepID=A0A7R9L984_9ACAR|nr:unnamed protein product [Medioppia subpectinata]CAG2116880.1 unnamed protein product [Medioppia subpectinata]
MPQQHISQLPRLGTLVSSLDGHQRVNLHCRVVVLGAAKVGKTAIVEQFLYDAFPVLHSATVEQLYRAEYQVRGTGSLTLDILDTSGSYEFPAMRQLAIKSGDAFILVFSVDDSETFEEVRRLRELILEIKSSDNNDIQPVIPICVVGNKSDFDDKRVIRKEVAESVICLDWENGYVECSAKENKNVVKIFQELMIQAKVPYDVGPAIANGKPRRSSLPECPTSPVSKDKGMPKRNSCAVS